MNVLNTCYFKYFIKNINLGMCMLYTYIHVLNICIKLAIFFYVDNNSQIKLKLTVQGKTQFYSNNKTC